METNQTVTETDEIDKDKLEKANRGLIADLSEQRKKNRALEDRLTLIESSLNAPEEKPPTPADVRVQKFAEDPDAYIRDVISPVFATKEEVEPLRRELTSAQIDRKLDNAMEWIAEEEGITRREAAKKYEKPLAEIVESHDFSSLDPYNGTLAAYKILKTEKIESEEKEKVREKTIQGQQSETVRSQTTTSKAKWTTSKIAGLTRDEWNKNKDEILKAQREGLVVRDT